MSITENEQREARARANRKYREENLDKCRELARIGAKRIYDNDIENKRLHKKHKYHLQKEMSRLFNMYEIYL